jgi:hypothetical protein
MWWIKSPCWKTTSTAGRKRTTGRQDQGQRDARTEEGQGAGRSGAGEQKQKTEVTRADLNAEKIKGPDCECTLSVDYFVADFFSSTRMTSIGPLPMFSGRCAPAGEKTASPFFPDTSSLLPSG